MRRTKEERAAMQQEALGRAVGGQSFANWPAIIHGFAAKGIAESDIRPRENVFTYHAWRALGRQVRRGEHGVKVLTFVSVQGKDAGEMTTETVEEARTADAKARRPFRHPWTATVFHVSQTDPIATEGNGHV